ncbi:MAG: cation:proton antiporter [Polyangiaceae bacterium]
MTVLESVALVVTLASIFAYANLRWLKLPPTVGLMAIALVASLLLLGIDKMGWLPLKRIAGELLAGIDFNEALMHGMLGGLLFAGALHVKIGELRSHAVAVLGLAAGGTLISTFAVRSRSSSRLGPPASRSSPRS